MNKVKGKELKHTWLKEIAIDPYDGPHIIWHKIITVPVEYEKEIERLKAEPSPDGASWKMK